MADKLIQTISNRYDALSGQECCLSCGGAINYAAIEPGFTCVDLGSGKGYDVLKMATMAGVSGFAYGVDVSDKMMEVARQNALKLNLSNVEFVKSPLEQIGLADNLADLVLSNCTINHSLSQGKVWKEIFRILKPYGTFVVSDIFSLHEVPLEYRNDPTAVSECWAGSVTRETYFENIQNAGFDKVEIIEESKPYDKGKIQVCSFTIKGKKPF